MVEAWYCPKCGSEKVSGGLGTRREIAIVLLLLLGVMTLIGILLFWPIAIMLWLKWRKAQCHSCDHIFIVSKKTNELGAKENAESKK